MPPKDPIRKHRGEEEEYVEVDSGDFVSVIMYKCLKLETEIDLLKNRIEKLEEGSKK